MRQTDHHVVQLESKFIVINVDNQTVPRVLYIILFSREKKLRTKVPFSGLRKHRGKAFKRIYSKLN